MSTNLYDLLNKQVELSFTPPQNFFMVADYLPTVMFTVQRMQVPVVSGEEISQPNPMNPTRTSIPGSNLEYGVLSTDFILDKHMKNYQEVLKWLKGNYAPEDKAEQAFDWNATMSTITVIATDAGNTPLMEWKFYDAFPISLDGPMFDATMPDVEYLTSNVTFRHKYFTFTTYTDGASNHDPI